MLNLLMSSLRNQSGIPPVGDEKFDFSSLYNQPEPRSYFNALTTLDYEIPQLALPIFKRVLEVSRTTAYSAATPRKVLDVCCSYGINSALLKCNVNLDTMALYYKESAELPLDQRVLIDNQYFAQHVCCSDLAIIGLDVANKAVYYGTATGLLTSGWVENLETQPPSALFCKELCDVTLVLCTGGVGYVGVDTFRRIVASVANPAGLWVVSFVLRTFDYSEISAVLDRCGLITEKIPDAVFRQRRFATPDEQHWAVAKVMSRGLDPTGLETDGSFYADCYITRPYEELDKMPNQALYLS